MLRDLLDDLDALQNRLRRSRAVNVNDRQTKSEVISVAGKYFSVSRKALVQRLGETKPVLEHDQKWQDLIRLAHGNNARRSYLKAIHDLRTEAAELNVAYLSGLSEAAGRESGLSDLTPAETMIVKTLENSVPSAAASYRQAILDLACGDRLSYRGTASELRESLREMLDHLAPDADVISQQGFVPEENQRKPTMKQKAKYILVMRQRTKTQRVAEKSVELVDSLTGEITRAIYDRASIAAHVEASRSEVLKIKRYVDTVFFDLLEIADNPKMP